MKRLLKYGVLLGLVAGFSAQAAAPFFPLKADPTTPQEASCPMGECVWFKWQNIQVTPQDGELRIQATALRGYSEEEERRKGQNKIAWEASPMVFTVICSSSQPSVVFTERGQEQRHELPLAENGAMPSYLESSARLYFKICHSADVKNISSAVQKFHYSP